MSRVDANGNDDFSANQSYAVKFINPDSIIREIGIATGSIVADFGCGGGYFSLPIAKLVGESGTVYALDILVQSLEMINGYAKTNGLTNIITKRVNLERDGGSTLKDNSCDWVIMKDVLFQNNDKSTIIKEASRILRAGGKALVIEWNTSDFSIGPAGNLRITKESLIQMACELGLVISKEVSVGDFHYGLVLTK